MILDLNKIYQYIFNDWADVNKTIKADLDESKKNNIKNNKETIIKTFFFEPVDKDHKPRISEQQKSSFRTALRTLNSTHLERILYGNTIDELKEQYSFPDEQQIETYFYDYENAFNYFSQNKEKTAAALTQFKKFFKVCKLIGDFIENNNDQNNTVASTHAYKILILFGNKPKNDFELIDNYLRSYNFNAACPLHDALLHSIPKNENIAPIHLDIWRKLIQQSGPKAFQLFNLATAIEKLLNKPPATFTEAIETAKKISYKNADKYPELAELCFQYHLSEQVQKIDAKNLLIS